MNSQDKALTTGAAVLLATAFVSASASPIVCLASAICALTLSLYLRHRGAFRDDNTPLLGALLIGGSAITVLTGALVFAPLLSFVMIGLVMVPAILFLLAVLWRWRLREFIRRIDELTQKKDEEPPL
jgi:hypothetical protein